MLQKIIASYQPPIEELEKYITSYWTAYNPTNEAVELPIVPDGSMDIIWLNGYIFLSGLMEEASVISIAPEDKFFGIQFKPYALALLLECSVSEFNNKDVPLESLNKVLEEDIRAIIEKKEDSQHIDAFNHYFKKLFSDKSVDALLLNTLELLHASHGNTLVSDCAKVLEVHPKKLERLFIKNIGVSVKKYSKIIRFYDIHAVLEEEGLENLTHKVLDKGYFDQAHFNRDFKKITG
ncbi:MAG: helix-turn-helix domain-containing protein, partial [Sulfurovum sp.]|nr:helix-turn-helix domain-containing protein [Sulfurovum sp.]